MNSNQAKSSRALASNSKPIAHAKRTTSSKQIIFNPSKIKTEDKANQKSTAKAKIVEVPAAQKVEQESFVTSSQEIAPGLIRTPESIASEKKSAEMAQKYSSLPPLDHSRKITIRGDTFRGDEPQSPYQETPKVVTLTPRRSFANHTWHEPNPHEMPANHVAEQLRNLDYFSAYERMSGNLHQDQGYHVDHRYSTEDASFGRTNPLIQS